MATMIGWQELNQDPEAPWFCDRHGDGQTLANVVNVDTEEALCNFHYESEVL